jgi:hypothetical protein
VVRRALSKVVPDSERKDPVARLKTLSAETGDIDQIFAKIERGRFGARGKS